MDHRTGGRLSHDYLSVREGDLVEVLEIKGNNYYVCKFPLESSEEENENEEEQEEGFVPACCLQPLFYTDSLNHNSNNNASDDVTNWPDQHDNINIPGNDLQKDWSVFCLRTGRFDPFPGCASEHELLNAKMDSLVKYYSDQHERLGLSDQHERLGLSDTTKEDNKNASTIERCVPL